MYCDARTRWTSSGPAHTGPADSKLDQPLNIHERYYITFIPGKCHSHSFFLSQGNFHFNACLCFNFQFGQLKQIHMLNIGIVATHFVKNLFKKTNKMFCLFVK